MTPAAPPDLPASMSLDEVGCVIDWLNGSGFVHQINGGWAVDAHVGRQTREHRDLDVFLDADGVDAFVEWLSSRGYRVVADERPVRIELAGERGRVDAHPMVLRPNGDGVQAGFDGAEFVHAAADRVVLTVAGRPIVVAGVRRLRELHQGYEPRPVDLHDLALLASLSSE